MNDLSKPTTSGGGKALWAVIGALGAAVVALGGALVYTQTRPAAPPAVTAAASAASAAPAAAEPASVSLKDEKALGRVASPEPEAPRKVVKKPPSQPAARDTGASQTMPAPSAANNAPARPVCANCGRVESVTALEHAGDANGTGAVAGGVLGAIVGNQIGDGSGRTVATVLGAVGGGMAGNAIEKRMKKTTSYQVQVRMEDGSVRTIEQATAPAVGAQVVVEGNTLRGR